MYNIVQMKLKFADVWRSSQKFLKICWILLKIMEFYQFKKVGTLPLFVHKNERMVVATNNSGTCLDQFRGEIFSSLFNRISYNCSRTILIARQVPHKVFIQCRSTVLVQTRDITLMARSHCMEPGMGAGAVDIYTLCKTVLTAKGQGMGPGKICNGFPTHFSVPEIFPSGTL